MSNVSSVSKYFATANEGFTATLQTTIAPGAAVVGLSGVAGLTNGSVFVGIIEPGGNNQQVFTGTVDTVGSQITGVVWTRGANVTHYAGVTIVDYTTGTLINMLTTGILKFANQYGELNPVFMVGADRSKVLEFGNSSNAVNHVAINNGATGFDVVVKAVGTDANIPLDLQNQGSDLKGNGLRYNGVGFRAKPMDWTRALVCQPLAPTSATPAYSGWGLVSGTGFVFPGNYMSAPVSPGTVSGDTISYKVYMDAGTYTVKNYFLTNTDYGIVTFSLVDEQGVSTNVAGLDNYSASGGWQGYTSTGIVIPHGQYFLLTSAVTGKNASSTAYRMAWVGTQITRTA